MKKIYCFFILIVMTSIFVGCSNIDNISMDNNKNIEEIELEENLDIQSSISQEKTSEENDIDESSTIIQEEYNDGVSVNRQSMSDEFYVMTKPVDAVIRCMYENNMEYNPRNSEFFWKALSYFVGSYGINHELAEVEYDKVKLPKNVVQEFATILFYDYDDLLDIPESIGDEVAYDENYGGYIFKINPATLSYATLESVETEEKEYTVIADFYTTGKENVKLSSKWEIKMVDNPYISGIQEPKYIYTIKSITKQ